MATTHICLTCSGFFPAEDFRRNGNQWLHESADGVHPNTNRSTQPTKELPNMATKTTTAAANDQFLNFMMELNALTQKYLGNAGVQAAATAVATSDNTPDPKRVLSEKALKTVPLAELREMAVAWGYEEDDVADAGKTELIDGLLAAYADEDEDGEATDADTDDEALEEAEDDEDDEDAEDEEEEDEAEDEDEDEDEDDLEAEREELMALTLAKLRKTARDDYNATAAELKGLDKEAIVDLILGADEEDDSDVDLDEEGDEEDGYTEDELQAMEADELKEILDEWEIEYSAKARKATLVKLVLEAQEEEDYEDEDEDDE